MARFLTRRDFLYHSSMAAGTVVVSIGLSGCLPDEKDKDKDQGQDKQDPRIEGFLHGVASGDPKQDRVILWTRVTPKAGVDQVQIGWQVATDAEFTNIVTDGISTTKASRDFTLKVDAAGLEAGTTYHYRFISEGYTSTVGTTRTLPTGDVDAARFLVMSCANYPAGYFNVYNAASQRSDIDAVLHLGDYLYEYGMGGYATDQAEALGRAVLPTGELLTLDDYRQRYAQYHTDLDLQALRAALPFIQVWDDHEVTNDSWKDGAENHNDGEGDYAERKAAALQAFFEWLPVRPAAPDDQNTIYRSFDWGNLLSLHMLDTRLIGRDQQLEYSSYIDPDTGAFDTATFSADIASTTRSLMGAEQLAWLQTQMSESQASWQVLGQQVLMGRMLLPAPVATQQMTLGEYGALVQKAQTSPGDLTAEEQAILAQPSIPYNLDAWDGYAYERELVLGTAQSLGKNLVVLAGDTHNAWANYLTNQNGDTIGAEFATSSVTSPGLEKYLSIPEEEIPASEAAVRSLVNGLEYVNLNNRGFMELTLTADKAEATWFFVDTIASKTYQLLTDRQRTLSFDPATKTLS